jgi:ABC-type transport system involved in cytochrome bd biosynthesis fused ATPase/permease subunit
MQNKLNQLLNLAPVLRIRRNHALEHATMQILAQKNARLSLFGYSDLEGFSVVGNLSTDELQAAVNEALKRLKAGEWELAIHPHCGTNFVAGGVVAGALAWLAMARSSGGLNKRLERLPVVMALVTLGTMLAQPLGPWLQAKVTTQAQVGELEVVSVTRYQREGAPVHKVRTK